MKKRYVHFIPSIDAQLAVWAGNYKLKLGTIGPLLGLTAVQVTDQEAIADRIIAAVNKVEVKRTELENAVEAKEESKVKDVQLLVNMAIAMKRHPDYITSLGSDLGIVGTLQILDPENLKPLLKGKAASGKVILRFNLQAMNCVSVYSRIKGSMGWEKLGNDYKSPFEDRRSLAVANQPEIREYMVRYFNGREDVGLESDIVTIVFGG
jgi:hypothetical protein